MKITFGNSSLNRGQQQQLLMQEAVVSEHAECIRLFRELRWLSRGAVPTASISVTPESHGREQRGHESEQSEKEGHRPGSKRFLIVWSSVRDVADTANGRALARVSLSADKIRGVHSRQKSWKAAST
jgi:hypothetical protein